MSRIWISREIGWIVAGLLAIGSGCSVDMFSSKPDGLPEALQRDGRAPRPECSGLRFDTPEMDPAKIRALVRCYDANGSVPDLAEIVEGASDRVLSRASRVLNRGFLSSPERLAETSAAIGPLDRGGNWEKIVAGFRYLLGDAGRFRAAARIATLASSDGVLARTISRLDPAETGKGLALFVRLARSPAFRSLRDGILAQPMPLAERDRLVDLLSAFFRARSDAHSARAVSEALADGKGAELWTYLIGSDGASADAIAASAARTRRFLDRAGADGGRVLRELSLLHGGFAKPIACWQGGKIFDQPWANLSEEIAQHRGPKLLPFITRFASLTAVGVKDLCEIPPEFLDHFPASLELSTGPDGPTYVALIDRLAARGGIFATGKMVGEWGGTLAEILSLLRDRPWFGDLVLLVAELDGADRDLLAGWMRGLLAHADEWDAFAGGWDRAAVDSFFADFGALASGDVDAFSGMLEAALDLFEAGPIHPVMEGWKAILSAPEDGGLFALIDDPGLPHALEVFDRMAGDGRLAGIVSDSLAVLGGRDQRGRGDRASAAEALLSRSPRHRLTGAALERADRAAGAEGNFEAIAGVERGPSARVDPSIAACARLDLRKRPDEQWADFSACAGGTTNPGELAEREKIFSWRLEPDEPAFFDRFVQSWSRVSSTRAEKSAIVSQIAGAIGSPDEAGADVRALASGALSRLGWPTPADAGDASSPGRALFAVLGRMRSELGMGLSQWSAFFRGVSDLLSDPDFAPVANAIRRMQVEPAGAPIAVERPAEGASLDWISDFECESRDGPARARAARLSAEPDEAVLGWEWGEGELPTAWSADSLEPRALKIAGILKSPAVRRALWSFVASKRGGEAAAWFASRAVDLRPVALMDPSARRLRVRWMTSLDRLESVLVNSNFFYLIPRNHGLRFMAKFAESWGDEPRSAWPAQIQKRYPGRRRPPTLAETLSEVDAFLSAFERARGLPTVPGCVSRDGARSGRALDVHGASAPDALVPFEVKAKAFNLRQTVSVIRENLPGAGGSAAGGMRFLRDLFWALHSQASDGEDPLVFLQALGDLGGLRQIARAFRSLPDAEAVSAVADAWDSAAAVVAEPAFDRLVERAVSAPDFVTKWVREWTAEGSAPRFGSLVTAAVGALAADRRIGAAPAAARIADRASPSELPVDTLLDLLSRASLAGEKTSLRRRVAASSQDARALVRARELVDRRVDGLDLRLPIASVVSMLEKEPMLRRPILEALLGPATRQSAVGSADAASSRLTDAGLLDAFLSENHPELRSWVSKWASTEAPAFVDGFAGRPDEAALIVDGALRSVDSDSFEDFMDALLRELAR